MIRQKFAFPPSAPTTSAVDADTVAVEARNVDILDVGRRPHVDAVIFGLRAAGIIALDREFANDAFAAGIVTRAVLGRRSGRVVILNANAGAAVELEPRLRSDTACSRSVTERMTVPKLRSRGAENS
jgi:hypothetical protein